MKFRAVILILFALAGAYVMQGNITGNVISESCCIGPECAPETACNFQDGEDRGQLFLFFLGTAVFVFSMLLIFLELRKKVEYPEENPNL